MLDGVGVSYALESGNRIKLTEVNSLAAKADFEGDRIGLGNYRTSDELSDGFSFKTVEYFTFDYESDFLNLSTDVEESLNNGEEIGLNIELAYKKSFNDTFIMALLFGESYEDKFEDGRYLEVSSGGLSVNMVWMFL